MSDKLTEYKQAKWNLVKAKNELEICKMYIQCHVELAYDAIDIAKADVRECTKKVIEIEQFITEEDHDDLRILARNTRDLTLEKVKALLETVEQDRINNVSAKDSFIQLRLHNKYDLTTFKCYPTCIGYLKYKIQQFESK